MIAGIIGLGILAFLYFYLAFNLEERHQVIKAFALFFGVFILILLSKGMIDSTRECDLKLMNETLSNGGNVTTYDYDTICYDITENVGTSNTAFRLNLGFVGILFIYLISFLFWFGGGYLKEVIKR